MGSEPEPELFSPAPAPQPQQSTSDATSDDSFAYVEGEPEPGLELEPEPEPEQEPHPTVEPEPDKMQRVRLKRLPCVIKGSEVAASVKFPEKACHFCLEEFADLELPTGLADKDVVALECGHAICLECLYDYRKGCSMPFHDSVSRDNGHEKHSTKWVCFCYKPLRKKKKYWFIKVRIT